MELVLYTSAIALCMWLIHGQLLSVPMNTIAKVGQSAELECSTNETLPVRWDFVKVNSTQVESIYKIEEITASLLSRYKVNASIEGRFALLVIDSVDMDHAGTYKCENTPADGTGQQKDETATAQLIVIDSDPVCDTNASIGGLVEGDYIQMQCSFNFSGNWISVMEWTRDDGRTVYAGIRQTYEARRVTSSLTTRLTSTDSGVIFTCRMSLNPNSTYCTSAGGTKDIKATNIPQYQRSCNYTALVLLRETTTTATTAPSTIIFIIGISAGVLILSMAIAAVIYKIGRIGVAKTPNLQSPDAPSQPIYGMVMKNRTGDVTSAVDTNHSLEQPDVQIYAEVNKNKNGKKKSGSSENKPKQNFMGDDGTVYEAMHTFSAPKLNRVPVQQSPLFSEVETYACIDHTMAVPRSSIPIRK